MAYVILWTYRVKEKYIREFETTYAGGGRWAKLFSQSPGYVKTDLLRGRGAGEYCTLDYWESKFHFEQFKQNFRETYAALDRETEAWTESETKIGTFETTGGS
jgi:heme-degrading monooxygenase HmoA